MTFCEARVQVGFPDYLLVDMGIFEQAVWFKAMRERLGDTQKVAEFEKIAKAMHDHDALVYMDGANLNAVMGVFQPGRIGADVMHFNLHKTFTTPHGGGGPSGGLRFAIVSGRWRSVPAAEDSHSK